MQPVSEELREQLEVWCFTASRARPRKLEERLQELNAAHVREVNPRPVVHRQAFKEPDVGSFGLNQRRFVGQIDRAALSVTRIDSGTGLDAQAATRAVLDIELQTETHFGEAAHVDRRRFERRWRLVEPIFVVVARPDHAVGTHETALSALDA